VLKALAHDNLLTCGTEHLDVDWQAMWCAIGAGCAADG
jgi:hypothetical protein